MSEEPREPDPKPSFRKNALSVINTISLLIGIVAGVMHLKEISRHAEDIASFLKISSIGYLEDFTDQYEATQANRVRFLSELEAKNAEVRDRLEAGETGQTIYHSPEMEDYHAVCGFWERSAAFVELGYFDFEIVYALKSFPRDFWAETAGIREMLAVNWYGKDRPLVDFLSGMEQLEEMYREEDARNR